MVWWYDWRWFDRRWIYKDTWEKYDRFWFDRYGIHKDTWTRYDVEWKTRDYKSGDERFNFLKNASKEEIKYRIRKKLNIQ